MTQYKDELRRIIHGPYTLDTKHELLCDVFENLNQLHRIGIESLGRTIERLDEENVKANIELSKFKYAKECENVHREDKKSAPDRNTNTGTC